MVKLTGKKTQHRKGLAAIYRQEIIQEVTLFTSQSAAVFYDKLFSSLDFTLPKAATGRCGFPKEAMLCAFLVMKCEGFSQITDLADYLDNNLSLIHIFNTNLTHQIISEEWGQVKEFLEFFKDFERNGKKGGEIPDNL